MKLTILGIIALLAVSTPYAQARPIMISTVQQQGVNIDQEKREVSAALKEVHGDLSNQLRVVSELVGSVDRIAAVRLVEIQEEIKADIGRTESGLDRIRTADADTWPAMKTELEALTNALRTSSELRKQGLSEAYGDK